MNGPVPRTVREPALLNARLAEGLTYRHWEAWRDSPDVRSRKLALKAKCFGVVAFDRIMRYPYESWSRRS